jgi:hypothetical protein
MQAGLFRFGTDFGNGAADQRFFPWDVTAPHYLAEKARVLSAYPERNAASLKGEDDERILSAAARWFDLALQAEEHGGAGSSLAEVGQYLLEDFAVLKWDPTGDRVLFVHACFPSGWRPEAVLGRSFREIHARIAGIEDVVVNAKSLTEAMVRRGPYLRFVWTISADAELDHHPELGKRADWSEHTKGGFLRVERQVTVPLQGYSASVFLIRTYLYSFEELTMKQRHVLRRALELMPPEIVRYKRLEAALPRALELLS